jgi:hypothetical protein
MAHRERLVSIIDRDVAIIICSRGREAYLTRLLSDLQHHFTPALHAGGLTFCIWVYAQHYTREYLADLTLRFADLIAANTLMIMATNHPHTRIGDVVQSAVRAVHEHSRYRLAMLMDDDSVYYPDPLVDRNLRTAAGNFIDRRHRAYSIKLGARYELEYQPFIDLAGPIMPFKEKMLWASRPVLEEVVSHPRFAELSIGEDAVISAIAWLPSPESCFGVYGMATFLHLGYEPSAEFGGEIIDGGYADLVKREDRPPEPGTPYGKYDDALRRGITPQHILPDVFVPEGHPHYAFNGIRDEVIAALATNAVSACLRSRS